MVQPPALKRYWANQKKSVNYQFHSKDKKFEKCLHCGVKKDTSRGGGHSNVCYKCFRKYEHARNYPNDDDHQHFGGRHHFADHHH